MAKGRDAERLAADVYEHEGYQTWIPPKAKYREQDVFGLFDIVAFGNNRLEFIQVKGGRDASGINSWFQQATTYEEHVRDLRVTFMHRTDDAWRIARSEVSSADGYRWVYDGRNSHSSPLLEEVIR